MYSKETIMFLQKYDCFGWLCSIVYGLWSLQVSRFHVQVRLDDITHFSETVVLFYWEDNLMLQKGNNSTQSLTTQCICTCTHTDTRSHLEVGYQPDGALGGTGGLGHKLMPLVIFLSIWQIRQLNGDTTFGYKRMYGGGKWKRVL